METSDHVSIILVICTIGKVYKQLVVIDEKKAKHQKQCEGKFEMPSKFLRQPKYGFRRSTAAV